MIIDDNFNLIQQDEIVNYLIKLLNEKNIKFKNIINQDEIDKIFLKVINQQKFYLQKAQDYALSKNGLCLSTQYIDNLSKLKWQCSNNHIWESNYGNTVSGKVWCPECGNKIIGEKLRNKNGLALAKNHAESKGGQCLSTEYINNSTKLKWQCSNHHIWEARYANVVGSLQRWCPQCAREKMKKI